MTGKRDPPCDEQALAKRVGVSARLGSVTRFGDRAIRHTPRIGRPEDGDVEESGHESENPSAYDLVASLVSGTSLTTR